MHICYKIASTSALQYSKHISTAKSETDHSIENLNNNWYLLFTFIGLYAKIQLKIGSFIQ